MFFLNKILAVIKELANQIIAKQGLIMQELVLIKTQNTQIMADLSKLQVEADDFKTLGAQVVSTLQSNGTDQATVDTITADLKATNDSLRAVLGIAQPVTQGDTTGDGTIVTP